MQSHRVTQLQLQAVALLRLKLLVVELELELDICFQLNYFVWSRGTATSLQALHRSHSFLPPFNTKAIFTSTPITKA